ncbi:MAG: hypothetical protein GY749_48585 [Desulfobacteraceae bacterium]|nr:hypothetical protein [Desulfobacteraceae bacterium]
MNSYERVMAAVRGSEVDRRPFAGVLSLQGAKFTKCPLDRYYSDSQAYIDGMIAVRETICPDIVHSPFILAAEGNAFGSEIKYFDEQAPNLKTPVIHSVSEFSKLQTPDIDSHPRLVYIREAVRGLKKKYGNEVAVAGTLLNPCDMPIMLMTLEEWLPAVICEDEAVERILDITVPFFVEWANTLADDGADFLVMPSPFTSPRVITHGITQRFALPVLKQTFSQLKIPLVLHHAGGQYLNFLDIFNGLPNLMGFSVDHTDPLHLCRDKIGPDTLLLGGIDGPNLDTLTPEEAYRKTGSVLLERSNDPYFLFMLTGPDVVYRTPVENILAVRRAVEEHRPNL